MSKKKNNPVEDTCTHTEAILGVYMLFCFDTMATMPFMRQKAIKRERGQTDQDFLLPKDEEATPPALSMIPDDERPWKLGLFHAQQMSPNTILDEALVKEAKRRAQQFLDVSPRKNRLMQEYGHVGLTIGGIRDDFMQGFLSRWTGMPMPKPKGINPDATFFLSSKEERLSQIWNDRTSIAYPYYVPLNLCVAKTLFLVPHDPDESAESLYQFDHNLSGESAPSSFVDFSGASGALFLVPEYIAYSKALCEHGIHETGKNLDKAASKVSTKPVFLASALWLDGCTGDDINYQDIMAQAACHRVRLEQTGLLHPQIPQDSAVNSWVLGGAHGNKDFVAGISVSASVQFLVSELTDISDSQWMPLAENNFVGAAMNKIYLSTGSDWWQHVMPQSPYLHSERASFSLLGLSPLQAETRKWVETHGLVSPMKDREDVWGIFPERYLPRVESQAFELVDGDGEHGNGGVAVHLDILINGIEYPLEKDLDAPKGEVKSFDIKTDLLLGVKDRLYYITEDMFYQQPPQIEYKYIFAPTIQDAAANRLVADTMRIENNVFNRPLFLFTAYPPTPEDFLAGKFSLSQNGLFSPIPLTQIILLAPTQIQDTLDQLNPALHESTKHNRRYEMERVQKIRHYAWTPQTWNDKNLQIRQSILTACRIILYSKTGVGEHKGHSRQPINFAALYGEDWYDRLVAERESWLERLAEVLALPKQNPAKRRSR